MAYSNTTYKSRSMRQRRGTDKWEVRLTHKNPLTNEVETSYHTIEAKTEAQAIRRRDELIRTLSFNGSAFASDETVQELLAEFIEHKRKSGGIEESTANYYEKDARAINRHIGGIRIADVTIAVVDNMLAEMEAEGLAPRTIARPFRLLKQAMKFAVATDKLAKNPCDYCKPPKLQRKHVNSLSRDERTRMLKLSISALNTPIGCAVGLALTTGMRRGEICGLRWSDLNADATISVNRAIGEKKGGVYEKDPKTPESRRTIPLTPRLYAYLSAMKTDSLRIAKEFGLKRYDPYILGTQEPDSKPYQPTRLTREFRTFCDTNGFQNIQFHDLRHTFASMLIADSVDVRTVASYLGHTNVAMTLNTYAEVDPEAKRAAVGRIQAAFDIEESEVFKLPSASPEPQYTVAQLEAMLAEARKREGLPHSLATEDRL